MVRAVVFDVGCTLIDETRAWTAWAEEAARATARIDALDQLPRVLASL